MLVQWGAGSGHGFRTGTVAWAGLLAVALLVGPAGVRADSAARQRVVNTLGVSVSTCSGGVNQAIISYSEGMHSRTRVGFFSGVPQAFAPDSHASAWMATAVASLIAGRPLRGSTITFERPWGASGPSAGALYCIGVLAAMRDDPILPHVTMTGTINPDGSVGRVGGIYHKVKAAKEKGMTKVLIPAGQSTVANLCTHVRYQIADLSRQWGIKIIEVRDIFEAYPHLTGRKLFQVKDHGRRFKLPAPARAVLRDSYHRWHKIYGQHQKSYGRASQGLDPKERAGLETLVRRAQRKFKNATGAFAAGQLALAQSLMWFAAMDMDLATHLAEASKADPDKLRGLAAQAGPSDAEIKKRIQHIETIRLEGLNDFMTVCEAYLLANVALGLHNVSGRLLAAAGKPALKDPQRKETLLSALVMARLSANFLAQISEVLAAGTGYGGPPLPADDTRSAWSVGLYRAADANLMYVDRSILWHQSKDERRDVQTLRLELLSRDLHYMLGVTSRESGFKLRRMIKGGDYYSAALMGGSAGTFTALGMTVVSQWLIRVKYDPWGDVATVGYPQRLQSMLASARRRIRINLIQAQQAGCQPVIPIIRYHLAEDLQQGPNDHTANLAALYNYWLGSVMARIATLLASGPPELGPPQNKGKKLM